MLSLPIKSKRYCFEICRLPAVDFMFSHSSTSTIIVVVLPQLDRLLKLYVKKMYMCKSFKTFNMHTMLSATWSFLYSMLYLWEPSGFQHIQHSTFTWKMMNLNVAQAV